MKHVILLQILLLANVAAAATDPNLVGWWTFDEGNGTTAVDSAGGHNGTLINGPTWTTGQIGGGLKFDGINDYVEVPYYDSLAPGHITLSAWIQPDIIRNMMLIAKSNFNTSASEQYALSTNTSGIPYSSIKRNGSCVAGNGWYEVHSTYQTIVGQWCLVTSTWDGSVFKIYINGELNSSNSGVPAGLIDFCPGGTLRFGIWWSQGLVPFKGIMDDVRIYNRALSAEEINDLYEDALPILTALEIAGPDEVAEESTAAYKAIAHYDNGTTKDVTILTEWRAEPNNIADIDAGLLTTGQVLYPRQNIKIYAGYTENEIDVNTQKQVSVIAICPQGNSLMFDGVNDYVDVPDNAALRFTKSDSFSICSWAKPTSGFGEILGKMQSGSQYGLFTYEMQWNSTSQSFDFLLCNSGNYYKYFVTPTDSAPPGSWYHFACVYQNKDVKIYLNGELAGSGYFNSNPSGVADRNLAIGVRAYGSSKENYFNGTLDDVHIYNRALSADEIQTIMHIKPTGSDPNLVAYWDFDEGMGQMVADISGHGNNGLLGSSTGIDTADPCWVESDAPVGRCTTEQVLGRNLLGAIDNKKAANQLIDNAKARERASLSLIDEITEVSKQDALKAKAQIHVAIVQEETVSRQIDATIKRLEEALWLLDYVIDSNSEPPVPSQRK